MPIINLKTIQAQTFKILFSTHRVADIHFPTGGIALKNDGVLLPSEDVRMGVLVFRLIFVLPLGLLKFYFMECWKVKFRTKKGAKSALHRSLESKNPNRREVRYYYCPNCHCFHLTSQY